MHYKLFLSCLVCLVFITACKDDDQNPSDSFNELCCKVPPLEECLEGANIFVPNAFTPNNDGINDVFRVYVGIGIEVINLFQITDQEGNIEFVRTNFSPESSSGVWDGVQNNNQIEGQALYNYELRITNIANITRTYTGQVCSRATSPMICLEDNRDAFCIFSSQHDGNGGLDFTLDPSETCQ